MILTSGRLGAKRQSSPSIAFPNLGNEADSISCSEGSFSNQEGSKLMSDSVRLGIVIPRPIKDWVAAEAKRDDRSQNNIVVRALKAAMERAEARQ